MYISVPLSDVTRINELFIPLKSTENHFLIISGGIEVN